MIETDIRYSHKVPDLLAFIKMREACGWGKLQEETAQKTLSAGLINICVHDNNELIGFGRVIGDGAIYFYIQDLIVKELYQGQGIGQEILKCLLIETRKLAAPGAIIGLMSALGKEAFYEKQGFITRPNDQYGAGMMMNL